MRLVTTALLALTLVGCGGTAPGGGAATACQSAMADAAAVGDTADALADLYPAVRACATLAEFSAASALHPDALDGVEPEVILPNLCANEASITDTPLCQEVTQ